MERIVSGLLNKQVAAELGTSESTVKVHRGQVMQKDERSTWLTRFARSFIRSRVDNSTRTAEESG
jgi:FixJ family two-component response regulator